MSKRYSNWIHLLNPLPFVFHIFVSGDGKLIALWQSWHLKIKKIKLLWTSQMYKAGILPIHNNFHHFRQRVCMLASENMDLQVVGCMDRTRLQNKIETKKYFIILFTLEIVKIRRSPYAHFNFTTLHINTDVLSPMWVCVCKSGCVYEWVYACACMCVCACTCAYV